MINLLLDTATERSVVAIVEKGQCVFQEQLSVGYNHSQELFGLIEKGFLQLSLKASDLTYIALGLGPGSYTGMRVGAAAAKSIAYACSLPLVGICTLQSFIPKEEGLFAAIIDAKMGGAYVIKGNKQKDHVEYLSEAEMCSLEQLGDRLLGVDTIVSPFYKGLKPKLESFYPMGSWSWIETFPDVNQMARLAQRLFEQKCYAGDGQVDLLYFRKTQAEIEKEQRKQRNEHF